MSDWLLETIIKGIEELENEKKNPGNGDEDCCPG